MRPTVWRLTRFRRDPTVHWVSLVVAILAGLGLATLHWIGLVVGGVLVGLLAATVWRALLAGIGFGFLALCLWLGSLWSAGTLSAVLAMGEVTVLAILLVLVLPVVGSLARVVA